MRLQTSAHTLATAHKRAWLRASIFAFTASSSRMLSLALDVG